MAKKILNKKIGLWLIVILSIVSIVTSAYLYKTYHLDIQAGVASESFCDFNATFNCESVNTSSFAKILNIPVSWLGLLWSVGLLLIALWTIKKGKDTFDLWLYNVIGLGFVGYFIVAEIILRNICILCTLVHGIVITSLIISWLQLENKHHSYFKKDFWSRVVIKVLVIIAIIGLFSLFSFKEAGKQEIAEPERVGALAECLVDNGLKFYGSHTCAVCLATKKNFGSAFETLNEIECHPQGPNNQFELCQTKNIKKTPTWTVEKDGQEINRVEGFQSFKQLAELTGCEF